MDTTMLKEIKSILDKSIFNAKPLFILDGTAVTGIDGFALQCLEDDTTFTTLDCIYDGGDPAGLTLKRGDILYLQIKGTVDLSAGKVVIYQNKELAL